MNPKFKLGDLVRKTKGSEWHGTVVGTYSTSLTPEGYAVESATERGSVQKQRDEALLRQALEALEQIARDLPWELTGLQADTIAALRERLGVKA